MAVPLIILEIPLLKRKFKFNRLSLIIGSLLPDLIDKPFLLLRLGSGRSFSHTLLFTFICGLIVFLASKKNQPISFCLLFGLVTHLMLDLPGIPIFYPLIIYHFEQLERPIDYWIKVLFTDPKVYLTEILGAIIVIFILINNKMFSVNSILKYLKTSAIEV